MATQLNFLALLGLTSGENGQFATYENLGQWAGSHWMVETQSTQNDCRSVLPKFVRSRYCGPGHGRALARNVRVSGPRLFLSAQPGPQAESMNSTNAQIYLCKTRACLNGRESWSDAISQQLHLGYGDFVYQVESFTVDGSRSNIFPPLLVLGLYMYKPNFTIWGNVDTSNELDIEYAHWGGGNGISMVGFTTWPAKVIGNDNAGNLEASDSGRQSARAFPACAVIKYRSKKIQYALWSPVNGKCDREFCFPRKPPRTLPSDCKVATHVSSNRGQIPRVKMVPGINLWWHAGPAGSQIHARRDVTVVLTDFQYFPIGITTSTTTTSLSVLQFTVVVGHSHVEPQASFIPAYATVGLLIMFVMVLSCQCRRREQRCCRCMKKMCRSVPKKR